MKEERRGPFARIRWFCADGAVLPPRPYACSDHGGGVEHGEPSAEARRLSHLGYHVGTPFVALEPEDFLDAAHNFDRPREIVLQVYLRRADDGWVLRRARTYRGARQIEDEEAAGERLLAGMLADTLWVRRHFLLALEAVRGVPHGRPPERLMHIRDLARKVAESVPAFGPVRAKIHSFPDSSDVQLVHWFAARHAALPESPAQLLDELEAELSAYYALDPSERLTWLAERAPRGERSLKARLDSALRRPDADPLETIERLAELSGHIRGMVERSDAGRRNLWRVDVSLALQEMLVRRATLLLGANGSREPVLAGDGVVPGAPGEWRAPRRMLLRFARELLLGAYGRGLLSGREVQAQIASLRALETADGDAVTAREYRDAAAYLQRATRWAQGTVSYTFGEVIDRYLKVEQRAAGFEADLLRGSILLPLAHLSDRLSRDANRTLGLASEVFGHAGDAGIQGLNPGLATGVLEVVPAGGIARTTFLPDHIYLLPRSTPDLPPVAGILTLSEGSSLSHLQLLARSLGIPNAVVSTDALDVVRAHAGRQVVFAVAPLGSVVLRERSAADSALWRPAESVLERRRLVIDTAKLDLSDRRVLSLDELDATARGRIVGSKAAGVAALRRVFPGHVSAGFVLPFGIYRAHLAQTAAGPSLLAELHTFYGVLGAMKRTGVAAPTREAFVRKRLAHFRDRILALPLDSMLVRSLRERLVEWGPEGSYGAFVRSDTNVEDLSNFSGAGLNLTVPNRIRFADILNAIKRVWASPFTERAFGWRYPVLENPAATYVSVLIQRGIPVQKSGVLLTEDVETGRRDRLTVSAAEGLGGVVGGEIAETLLLSKTGGPARLMAQSKARFQRRLRMVGYGGMELVPTSGGDRVLTESEVNRLVSFARELEEREPPTPGPDGKTAARDVEFGFLNGHLWLFQVRPLATDPRTRSLRALAALDQPVKERGERRVDLDAAPQLAAQSPGGAR